MKTKHKTFLFFGLLIQVTLSRPRTTWWINDWHPKRLETSRFRQENLFGFTRLYSRTQRVYLYEFHCGRLKVIWSKIKQW